MTSLLGLFGRHAKLLLAVGIFLGLAMPEAAALVRPMLAPSVLVILAVNFLRAPPGRLLGHLRRPWVPLAIAAWLLIATPIMIWAILAVLPLGAAFERVLVLATAAPPIMSAGALALLLGLDGTLALVIVLLSTLLVPFVLPPLALALLGVALEVEVAELMLRLALVVAAAVSAAWLLRWIKGERWVTAKAESLDGVAVVAMLVFALAIMDGVAAELTSRPFLVAGWLLAALIANLALQGLGALAFLPLGRRAALTVGLASGNRNLGILVAALPEGGGAAMLLYAALAQVPVFIYPALLAPLYRLVLGRCAVESPPENPGE